MALRRVSLKAFLPLFILLVLLLMAIALPQLHQNIPPRIGHYETQSRQLQAQQARAIIANPQSPCTFYDCDGSGGSKLRVCVGKTDAGEMVHALQWLFFEEGGWHEGTVFLQRKAHKVDRYLENYGCKEMVR